MVNVALLFLALSIEVHHIHVLVLNPPDINHLTNIRAVNILRNMNIIIVNLDWSKNVLKRQFLKQNISCVTQTRQNSDFQNRSLKR